MLEYNLNIKIPLSIIETQKYDVNLSLLSKLILDYTLIIINQDKITSNEIHDI